MSIQIKKKITCPKCGKKLDGATSGDNPDEEIMPQKYDLSICLYCVAVLQYEEDLSLRELSDDELGKLPSEAFAEIMMVKASVVQFKEEHKI